MEITTEKHEREGGELGATIKGQMKDPWGDRDVLYLGYIDINILVVILYIVLQKVMLGGNWIKGTPYFCVLILTTSHEFTLPQNKV